jgi:hypothetical protein
VLQAVAASDRGRGCVRWDACRATSGTRAASSSSRRRARRGSGSELAQDELFGPVLATFTAADLDEAIALANRTRYGLSASLFTRDLGTRADVHPRIEAGLVRVNGDTTGVDPHAPFGGMKASSSGSREQGSAAREFYTEYKTVQISRAVQRIADGQCARVPGRMRVIDSHTEGEPTRVVVDGLAGAARRDMAARRDDLRALRSPAQRGGVRAARPRRHGRRAADAAGHADAAAGVIFFNNVGYLGMCGHGLIGVVRTLQHLGRLSARATTIDTPAGTVTAELTRTARHDPQRRRACHALDVRSTSPGSAG